MLTESAAQLRKYIITMNCYAGSGHPGGSLSSVEIVTYLFSKVINFSPENSNDFSRDRFVLSNGEKLGVISEDERGEYMIAVCKNDRPA